LILIKGKKGPPVKMKSNSFCVRRNKPARGAA
jgi:hypothetical protein